MKGSAQTILYDVSRELVRASTLDELGEITARWAKEVLGTDTAVLISRPGGELVLIASTDPTGALATAAVAHSPELLIVPMAGTRGVVGILAARLGSTSGVDAEVKTIETMVAQTALAIERTQLAREAEDARVAVETERTRSTLLAGLSHDLRTPLSAIAVAAAVLADSEATLDPVERKKLLTTVRDEAQKLTRLVTSLLDLVSIESGRVQVVKEWVPLEEILSSAFSRLEKALKGRQIHTDLGSSGEMLMVAADPILLAQVFVNLLDNAAKYTPPGCDIEITAQRQSDMLRVEVADHGRGIARGDEKRVFEKFYRSEKSSREHSGAGLGLALCDAIVRAHGGRIELVRKAEPGAVFAIYLPAEEPPRAANRLAEDGTS